MTTTNKGTRRELGGFFNFLTLVRNEVDPQIPPQTLQVLLYVAAHEGAEGVPMQDLAKAVGVAQSSVSRNVAALSEWNRHHRPGYGLVEYGEDPFNRRRKLVRLTRKGRALIRRVAGDKT